MVYSTYKHTPNHGSNRTTLRNRHKTSSIIFFDDMKYNIDDMKRHFKNHIDCIYLPHKKTNLFREFTNEDIERESMSESSNTYVEHVQKINPNIFTNTTKSFELDIHKPILYNWARAHKKDNKIIVFDWDHALSITNGVFPPDAFPSRLDTNAKHSYRRTQRISYQNANIRIHDIAVFLMGGHTRLLGLNRMFAHLYRRGCKIFILTANSIANTSRPEFVKVIQVIIPHFTESHLVCSNDGTTNGSLSKSEAIMKNPAFLKLIQK